MKRIVLKKTHKEVKPSPYPYVIKFPTFSTTLGDQLMCATFCNILNDNGIKAVLHNDLIKDFVECPIFNPNDNYGPEFSTWYVKDSTTNLYKALARKFETRFKVSVKVQDNYPVPTKFVPVDVDSVDVAVTTSVGQIYKENKFIKSEGYYRIIHRIWPYFDELFSLFDKHNISYIDLNKDCIINYEFLNHIRHCKVYLGLETGAAHYASKEGAGKTLIINSGFYDLKFWAPYDFEAIQIPTDCSPCWSWPKKNHCENDYKCMKEISPEMVLESVMKKMDSY